MRCAHEGCVCQVEDGRFCSGYCEEHGTESHGEHVCECGHAACQAVGE